MVFSDNSAALTQLCLWALMPIVSYFLQFTTLALYLVSQSFDGPMSG